MDTPKQTHTPGPWTAERCYDGSRTVCQMRNCELLVCVNAADGAVPLGYDATEANARLIAAAPELLAELEAVVEAYATYYRGEPSSCLKARALIAKVKG